MSDYKTKAKEIATKTAHVLPHVGDGLVFASSALMIATGIASHFNEKAAELVGKLGNEKLYYLTTAISILELATAITYFALYLTKKTDKQLEKDNKDLQSEKATLTTANQVLESNNQTLKDGVLEISDAMKPNEDTTQKEPSTVIQNISGILTAQPFASAAGLSQ